MRGDALRLAEEELTSYAPVLEAETPADRTTALDGASEPPAQIAETAADVAELGVKVAGSSSPAVRGDALTGVILAEAAAAAAARLVETNISSGPVFDRARAAAERAAKARASATRPSTAGQRIRRPISLGVVAAQVGDRAPELVGLEQGPERRQQLILDAVLEKHQVIRLLRHRHEVEPERPRGGQHAEPAVRPPGRHGRGHREVGVLLAR